ncbi:DnaD domain protein [Enterococcus faecalis]|uniref:DnaD domain-containing protein n=1 Tax=Enterococcus faecalis TaxID=1351 RepID=UPI0001B2E779|nr:DnaD domain protein [Enterococcus faecalis]EEU79974.1 DnaD domain-containing protein [Enterococcus faecalis Fly1]EGO7617902.1 DnaD domain protein [Enterococcus faecalis]EGO7913056.1 DnaD domain protein [Enterococcus faecalis]EHZ2968488.1 DnaD domain protein [Enterococcus faecalis]PQB33933.1 DnaD domain protein [Enterococcus faecalis]
MNTGYIKLYRKVTNSFVWTNANMFKLWSLCLMKASHKESRFIFNGQEIAVSSGQFVTGRAVIEKEFNEGVPRDQQIVGRTLWRWLKKFENEQMLSISSTPKYSVITINNWDDYQVNDQQVSNNRPTSVQQLSTYKNEKNEKNEKNVVVVEEQQSVFQLYQSIFGMLNSVTTQNLEYWCNDLSTELVSEALKISAKSNARNFKYTESILRNWEQKGVKTLDDVKALNVERERKSTKQQKSNTGHSDYDDLGF